MTYPSIAPVLSKVRSRFKHEQNGILADDFFLYIFTVIFTSSPRVQKPVTEHNIGSSLQSVASILDPGRLGVRVDAVLLVAVFGEGGEVPRRRLEHVVLAGRAHRHHHLCARLEER